MILLPCPYCGPRNSDEFSHFGEVVGRPAVASTDAIEWRRYLYEKRNPADWMVERWYHRAGCRKFFLTERHTVTNEVRATSTNAGEGAS